METAVEQNLNSQELEAKMEVNSVMLLREMHNTPDLYLRRQLFEQAADQEASLFSEMLDGAVITDFEFQTLDKKLYLLQPGGVTDWRQMHHHGVERAQAKANKEAGFRPYVQMARAELEESEAQEAMVERGEPAVMLKLSLCGNDVMSADKLKELGRDPQRQRAFLRVSVFDGSKMHIHSRSIDGLNLSDGRDVATGWGVWQQPQMDLSPDASSVDILDNQIYFDQNQMSVEDMHQLADKLVESFDALQTLRTGVAHKAGRNPEGVNTYKFVLNNEDLLTAHMESLVSAAARAELPIGHLAALTNDLRYDIMSSFKQRLEGTWQDYGSLAESVAAAGEAERQAGTSYGGCDTVLGNQSAESAGYVNAGGNRTPSRAEREKTTKSLRKEVVGKGACISCGAKGSVYGCRLCSACNKEWCDKYDKDGTQTPIKKLSRYNGGRAQNSDKTETFSEYWDRLGRKQELDKEAELAQAA